MRYCLAFDIAKGKSVFVLAGEDGTILSGPSEVLHSYADMARVEEEADALCGSKPPVIMEATSVYHLPPKAFFEARGHEVIVTNPLLTSMRKHTLRKTKTDAEDAARLAQAYFAGDFSEQREARFDLGGLRSQSRYLEFAVSQVSESKTKLRELAAVCFPPLERIFPGDALFDPGTLAFVARYPHPSLLGRRTAATVARSFCPGRPKDAFRYGKRAASVLSMAKSGAPAVGPDDPAVATLSSAARRLAFMERDNAAEREKLVAMARKRPEFAVYSSFPGIGEALAATLTAELGDLSRLATVKKAIAATGLDPTIVQSGRSIDYHGPISKRGDKYARVALFRCVIMILRYDGMKGVESDMTAYYKKKRSEGKHHYAAVTACCTKLLRKMYYRCKDQFKPASAD